MKPYMNTGIATKVYSLIDISLKCCMNNAINTLVDNAKSKPNVFWGNEKPLNALSNH